MTLDQANTTSTMVYGDNSSKTFFGRPNNNVMTPNVPSSPLLTYSYMNSPSQNNGSFKTNDNNTTGNLPQLSLSLMELSLNPESNNLHHHDNVISTSTSPNKLPYQNNNSMQQPQHQQPQQPTHQQSLSMDSNVYQRDLSPRFDIPFARQRGNSSGFPPIGGHLTSKFLF